MKDCRGLVRDLQLNEQAELVQSFSEISEEMKEFMQRVLK